MIVSRGLRNLIFTQAILVTLVGLVVYFYAERNGVSFWIGGALSTINLIFLTWSWTRILSKKLIAVPILSIVIKYAFLAFIIWKLIQLQDLHYGWFCAGIASIIFVGFNYRFFIKGNN